MKEDSLMIRHDDDLGQNPELQKAHTRHKDKGGHPKQPPEEVIKLQVGLQRKHY